MRPAAENVICKPTRRRILMHILAYEACCLLSCLDMAEGGRAAKNTGKPQGGLGDVVSSFALLRGLPTHPSSTIQD
eukprot:scaffold827_cov369-Prasinococcus_capsulatus_cf.AAC.19